VMMIMMMIMMMMIMMIMFIDGSILCLETIHLLAVDDQLFTLTLMVILRRFCV
jgi:hypothetical protein